MSENQTISLTTMVPEVLSSAPSVVEFSLLAKFVLSQTSEVVHRDQIRRWMKMVFNVTECYLIVKGLLEGARHLIYLACKGSG